jgi:hypothetical protein
VCGSARKARKAKILTGEKELQIIALFPLVQIITLAWLCRQIITVARRTGNQDYHTPLIILNVSEPVLYFTLLTTYYVVELYRQSRK